MRAPRNTNMRPASVWPDEKRRKLLRMCGYFPVDELARRMDVKVSQVRDIVARMGASLRVTKNPEDFVE